MGCLLRPLLGRRPDRGSDSGLWFVGRTLNPRATPVGLIIHFLIRPQMQKFPLKCRVSISVDIQQENLHVDPLDPLIRGPGFQLLEVDHHPTH